MLNKWLFTQIDNSPLIVFRVLFGLLIFLESVGAIFTGWVRKTLVDPEFTFSFIGLEWLQPLPGPWMYVYYTVMGLFGLMVMIGFRYRLSMTAFTLMWTATYLMQKSSYNNHYYLLILICAIMIIVPAHHYLSYDAKRNPSIKKTYMPRWVIVIFVLQLFIVYTYAAVAKIYPDWLDHTVTRNLMVARSNLPIIGDLLKQTWLHKTLTYGGILFDGLVVPALLWKRTRKLAFAASIVFHLFNSFVLHIGIFPYLSLAFILFFFPTKTVQQLFLKKKPYYDAFELKIPPYRNIALSLGLVYFVIQVALPLRHWCIEGDVLWTEEGHRMSWRMMLRSRSGITKFYVVDKHTGKRERIDLKKHLSKKQLRSVTTKPDMMWQFAQRLKQKYAAQGTDVAVNVKSKISINGKPYQRFIDSTIDLASVPWDPWKHHDWIVLPEEP